MLRVGLVGIGFMGRGHLDVYLRLEEEGFPIKLVAICDVDDKKFQGEFIPGNMQVGKGKYDFSKYRLYTSLDQMLENEQLDYVDIALPTYLHAEAAVTALSNGVHVLCEKPMARSSEECAAMIAAATENKKKLMIAQCLRFWPEYELLKEYVNSEKFGLVTGAYFYRGGGTPRWSYQDWLLDDEKSGGALLDQHIHDVDTINWLFGKPTHVSTIGRNVIPGSGYDIVSTHYLYPDGKVINAQDDWTLNGDYGFQMSFRVNFEQGNLIYEGGRLKVSPNDAEGYYPDVSKDNGYYREVVHFAEAIMNDSAITTAAPESTRQTICIAEAEVESAQAYGAMVAVK